MAQKTVMSRDDVEEAILIEIAEACNLSVEQIEDVYACTPLQTRTLAESAIRTGASVFQIVLSLAANVDIDHFCSALSRVVSLNSVLRTRLVDCGWGLVQVVTTEQHDTQRLSSDVDRYLRDDKARPLGLGEPLFRSAVINNSKLVFTMHHAIMDHSSLTPLFRDILGVYHNQEPGKHAPFKEFVADYTKIDDSVARTFWASRFKGTPSIFPRVEPSYVPNATQRETRKLKLDQIGAGVSMVHVPSYIEAAWALTAGVYTGSESVAFGLVLSGRTSPLAGAETTMGPTIAIVPVQVNFPRTTTVEGMLKDRTASRRQLQTQPALQYGVTKIREVSEAAKAASKFQTLLNIRPVLADDGKADELKYDYMDEPQGAFSLCLSCNMMDDGVFVEAMSDPSVIGENQLHRILQEFEHLLRSLIEASLQSKLERIPRLNTHDQAEIHRWNESTPKTVEMTLAGLFSTQAFKRPEALAVEACDGRATYRELDEMSNRLAHELRRRGVATGDPIAFIFQKSLWTVVAVFGILKAGGACVPIERSNPRGRKEAIISVAKIRTVLTSSEEQGTCVGLASDVLFVSEEAISALPEATGPLEDVTVCPEDLAYIIFTSGSTGIPKGVMLEHRSLASSLTCLAERFDWKEDCRMLQFAAHVWDISMGEMFGALLFGGCLCILSEEARLIGLADFIRSSKVNCAWLTPTVLRTLSPEEVPELRTMLSIGEPIDAGAASTWGKALRLVNGWGPCEASILSAVADLTPASPFPESIGGPIGCALWLVNPGKPNELAPIGAVGELLIEGPGVARGYLDDRSKTAAAFIPPPSWAPVRNERLNRFFRSGDLGRYNPDGSICFLGRQDNQVKIRGQRFELGELESCLSSCSKVRDVVATTKISQGRTELVTILCLRDSQLPRETVLQELTDPFTDTMTAHLRVVHDHAKSKLPSFMVPTIWLAVEQMPRTTSAKLDRTAIRDWLKTKDVASVRANLDAKMNTALTPPASEQERILQSTWSLVLGVPEDDIGRESSFVQLGGDSILAMQVASRCSKHGLRISSVSLLRGDSLTKIVQSQLEMNVNGADHEQMSLEGVDHDDDSLGVDGSTSTEVLKSLNIRLSRNKASEKLCDDDIWKIFPATDAQALMLATGEIDGKGYYVNFTLDFTPALDKARLRRACEQVIRHHAVLRTAFVQHGLLLYQVVLKDLPSSVVLEVIDQPDLRLSFCRDLTLARFHLVSAGQQCQKLCLEIHHALYDAPSIGLIFSDLDAAYAGTSLSQGPEFHSWVSHVKGIDKSTSMSYWREALKDSSMSSLVSDHGETISCNHQLDQISKIDVPLRNLQAPLGTPSSVMKAAWALLLSQALGTDDVVFGEVSANRSLTTIPRVDQVRGPCINFVPARVRLDRSMTLASFIAQVHDQATSSMPHHHLPFRSIIRDCTTWPQRTRFSSALAFQNHGVLKPSLRIGDAEGALSHHGTLGDSADVWVLATPSSDCLEIELCYSSDTIPHEQVRWISQCLRTIIQEIPSCLDKELRHFGDLIQDAVGSYAMSLNQSPPCLPRNGNLRTSLQAQETVLKAWHDLELYSKGQGENTSMFACGADVVTAFLLSEYFCRRGYDIKVGEIIRHPSRLMQGHLVDSKMPGVFGNVAQ